MKCSVLKKIFIQSLFIFTILWNGGLFAQEETYRIAHKDVFTESNRPAVHFPHTLHEESSAIEDCGDCHHVFDEQKQQIVYIDGEEQECKSCHEFKAKTGLPALREAFHKSCTGCHRRLKKNGASISGPTTCGECHRK